MQGNRDGTLKPPEGGGGEELVGYTLEGVYRLDAIISRGATSVVYRATNLRLDQEVAVKVLAAYLSEDEALMNRFETEAKLQAKLRHPNIVAVQDFVRVDNVYAIVMEFFNGVTLDRILYDLDGPMPLDQIREIIGPVLDAIGYAHDEGIIHRDIKPSNILLADVGGQTYPKVMDFGIAKVLAQSSSQNTAPGAMLGTLLYMSPEQCKALKTVDERSDVYSLGITLYQMATGMVPFFAESAFDIMMAHVQTSPPKPRDLVAEVSRRLEKLVLKALSKDPAQRYRSVGEMRQALDALPLVEDYVPPSSEIRALVDEPELVQPSRSSIIERELERYVGDGFASEPPASFDDAVFDKEIISLDELPLTDPDDDEPEPPKKPGPRATEPREVESEHLIDESFGEEAAKPRKQKSSSDIDFSRGEIERVDDPDALFSKRWEDDISARLKLRVPSSEDWDRFFDPSTFGGGIFCPTQSPPQVGTHVRVEITFVRGPRFFVHGAVTWRRPRLNDPRARAGVGIQVHPSERNKLSYVNSWVRGAVNDQRDLRRLPIKLRVTYTARAGRRINFTRDLHEEGLFIRSQELLELNTPIRLLLMPPDNPRPIELLGRVKRQVEARDERGMGIELRFRDDRSRNTYAAFVDHIERLFLAGELPDDAVA